MFKKIDIKKSVRLFLTGFTMGTADLVPGFSGGTVAFLSGIYEELVYSIKLVTGDVLRLFLKFKFSEAAKLIPFKFLVPLALGLFTAIFSLANLISYLLDSYPSFVFAFFFGLVIMSVFVVLKRVVKWDLSDKISFIAATVIGYFIVSSIPVDTPTDPIFFFLAGMVAITAMILPGISGSFILLLIGKYQQVLAAVSQRDFVTISIFMAGCVVGIAFASRFLSWLFAKHHDISVAVLAGLMLGSASKIWPWKETVLTRINSHGVEVPVVENNILPQALDLSVIFVVLLMILGAVLVFYFDKLQFTREHTKDIENKEFEKEYKKSLKNQ